MRKAIGSINQHLVRAQTLAVMRVLGMFYTKILSFACFLTTAVVGGMSKSAGCCPPAPHAELCVIKWLNILV